MKTLPFFVSTAVSAICLILSALLYIKTSGIRTAESALQKQQAEIQSLQDTIKKQEEESQDQQKTYQITMGIAQLKQQEVQQQNQIIEAGSSVAQKYGPPILRDIGYLAAKNNNEKLKTLLGRYKLEMYIPKPDELKQIEEARAKAQAQPAAAPAPR